MDEIGLGDYFDQNYFNIMISTVINITERRLAEIINSMISSKKKPSSEIKKNSIDQTQKLAIASVVEQAESIFDQSKTEKLD